MTGERNAPGQIVHEEVMRATVFVPTVAAVAPPEAAHRSAGGSTAAGNPAVLRLFDRQEGDQGAWLLPFALIGLVALALAVRGGGRRDRRRAMLFVMGAGSSPRSSC